MSAIRLNFVAVEIKPYFVSERTDYLGYDKVKIIYKIIEELP